MHDQGQRELKMQVSVLYIQKFHTHKHYTKKEKFGCQGVRAICFEFWAVWVEGKPGWHVPRMQQSSLHRLAE